MTIAEKLRFLAEMSEQDPADIGRILWRLDVLRDDLRRQRDQNDHSFVDDLCRMKVAS